MMVFKGEGATAHSLGDAHALYELPKRSSIGIYGLEATSMDDPWG